MNTKSYREAARLETFLERYEYLRLFGSVAHETFGFDRYLNQDFYRSREWKDARRRTIARDNGDDLGVQGFPIHDRILVHHINPITKEDLLEGRDCVFDLDNLITVSHATHNAIHYGDASLLPQDPIERRPGDTTPWR